MDTAGDRAGDIVVGLYAALARRDTDAVMAMMHPRARFTDFLDGGELSGPVAIRAFYQRMFDTLTPDFDLLSVTALPDGRQRAVMQVSVHDSAGHLWSDSRSAAVYTVADGLILSITLEPSGT